MLSTLRAASSEASSEVSSSFSPRMFEANSMDLNAIIETQRAFDSAHGWSLKGDDPRDLIAMLGTDLVGLLGEIGEFANLVKKLQRDHAGGEPHAVAAEVATSKPDLAEELTDT